MVQGLTVYWILQNMMQLHGLSTLLEDQRIACPTYSYLAQKQFHFVWRNVSDSESLNSDINIHVSHRAKNRKVFQQFFYVGPPKEDIFSDHKLQSFTCWTSVGSFHVLPFLTWSMIINHETLGSLQRVHQPCTRVPT